MNRAIVILIGIYLVMISFIIIYYDQTIIEKSNQLDDRVQYLIDVIDEKEYEPSMICEINEYTEVTTNE